MDMFQDKALQRLEYSALEKLCVARPVDRLDFMEALARDRVVFDLGALDETAFDSKKANAQWLHSRLCNSARRVIGIDNSAKLPAQGIDTINGGRIVHADIFNLTPEVDKYGAPDLIVAGELIEHLPDSLTFLRSLKVNPALRGAELAFSTPNACAWHNAMIGIVSRESMHRDHLQVYSYKTLRTLLDRAGIELLRLVPYYARFPEMISSSTGARRMGVLAFQRVVNALEYASPLMSAGWIGIARL
jgi:hypothetical protein